MICRTLPGVSAELLPWNAADLNQLLAAARTMPGDVAGVPACHWWPALLLSLIDTGAPVAELLNKPAEHFDGRRGTLAAGFLVYELHPATIEALTWISKAPLLLPWILDRGRSPFHMLYREYRSVLWRAGLPHVETNLFGRMRVTSRFRGLLDAIEPQFPFTPRPGKPELPRARTRRVAAARAAGAINRNGPKPPENNWRKSDARSLRRFFEETYRPRRLATGSRSTVSDVRSTLRMLNTWAGREVTLDELSDQLVEDFMLARIEAGKAIPTVNGDRAVLMALWSYAYRKRCVESAPRDVEKLRAPKRKPEAWSMDELARLLTAAAATPGQVRHVPAGLFWPMLIMVLYETGLRITAALSIRTSDIDAAGFVRVSAEVQKNKEDGQFWLHPDTRRLIDQTDPARRRLLFPQRNMQTLRHGLREILTRAGLPSGPKHSFHKLRRCSATHLANVAGEAAATRHLQHSSPQVTRAYLDESQIMQNVRPAEILPRPVWSVSVNS